MGKNFNSTKPLANITIAELKIKIWLGKILVIDIRSKFLPIDMWYM